MGKGSNSNFLFSNVYIKNILLMAIVSIALIGLILFFLNIYTRHNDSVNVPELKGMQIEDAKKVISSAHLRYEIIDSIYQTRGIPGSILEQIPSGNSRIKEGRTIYLTVQSISEPLVAVPDLEDASLRQSQTLLNALGFTNVTVEYIPSEYRDLVYSVECKGAKLKAGQKVSKSSPITIKVGDGGGIENPEDTLYNDTEGVEIEETFEDE